MRHLDFPSDFVASCLKYLFILVATRASSDEKFKRLVWFMRRYIFVRKIFGDRGGRVRDPR